MSTSVRGWVRDPTLRAVIVATARAMRSGLLTGANVAGSLLVSAPRMTSGLSQKDDAACNISDNK